MFRKTSTWLRNAPPSGATMSGRPSLLKSATTGSETGRRCEVKRRCERAGSIVQLDDDPTTFAGPHEIDVAIAVEVSNDRGLVCSTTAHVGRRRESAGAVADEQSQYVLGRRHDSDDQIGESIAGEVADFDHSRRADQWDRRRRLEAACAAPEDDHETDAVVVCCKVRVAVVVEVIDQDGRVGRRRAKGGRRLERAVSVAEPDRDYRARTAGCRTPGRRCRRD